MLPSHPYRLCTAHGDEAARHREIAELLRELQRVVEEVGCEELPPRHALLDTEPFGLRLSLAPFDDRWTEVFLSHHGDSGLVCWLTSDEGSFFIPPGAAAVFWPLVNALVHRLHGDEVEACLALAGDRPIVPLSTWVHPSGWWDDWRDRPLLVEGEATLGSVYDTVIGPRIRSSLRDAECRGRVVDVCGGDGTLATALRGDGFEVVHIDVNPVAHAAASARLGRDRCRLGDSSEASTWAGLTDVDVAVLAGAIQVNVMTPATARATMRHVHAALRPGGVAVIAGWSPCLMESRHFEEMGFRVRNCTVPPSEKHPFLAQHYVLERRGGDEDDGT